LAAKKVRRCHAKGEALSWVKWRKVLAHHEESGLKCPLIEDHATGSVLIKDAKKKLGKKIAARIFPFGVLLGWIEPGNIPTGRAKPSASRERRSPHQEKGGSRHNVSMEGSRLGYV
jgi:hypothetical protein